MVSARLKSGLDTRHGSPGTNLPLAGPNSAVRMGAHSKIAKIGPNLYEPTSAAPTAEVHEPEDASGSACSGGGSSSSFGGRGRCGGSLRYLRTSKERMKSLRESGDGGDDDSERKSADGDNDDSDAPIGPELFLYSDGSAATARAGAPPARTGRRPSSS